MQALLLLQALFMGPSLSKAKHFAPLCGNEKHKCDKQTLYEPYCPRLSVFRIDLVLVCFPFSISFQQRLYDMTGFECLFASPSSRLPELKVRLTGCSHCSQMLQMC